MRDHDEIPYVVIERHGSGAAPFLWGLIAGAGIALLLAPRSGAETQEEIRQRVRRVRDAAEDRVTGARDSVTGAVARTRDRLQDRIDGVRDAIETRTDQARDAVDTGRRAARDARSELERRVAEAKHSYSSRAASEEDGNDPGSELDPISAEPEVDVVITEVFTEEMDDRPDLG
jgi:gas vesicle protein